MSILKIMIAFRILFEPYFIKTFLQLTRTKTLRLVALAIIVVQSHVVSRILHGLSTGRLVRLLLQ
jgi:hypothetical protein